MVFPAAKIRPPRLRSTTLLARPALEGELAAALADAQAVLLSAPAGCGKTALLARVLEQQGGAWAQVWIALEPGDTLRTLVEALLAALEPYDPPWRQEPGRLIELAVKPEAQAELVAALTAALDGCDLAHGVIALDDLQHLQDAAALGFLDQLLHHLGPRWTLAMAARQAPELRLAWLRGRGALVEFDESRLRFSPAESRELLTAAGWTEAAADQLHARAAGWPAGLRLALNGARGSGAHIDRAAFELLSAEVLDTLTPELRRFLVDTSVLIELDPPRAAAVSGNARALHWLDEIQRLGLFVVLIDEQQPTLRLHDLFRDALRHRLRRERPGDEPLLLLRAAAVETDPVRRQGLLLAAGAHDEAARALLDVHRQLFPVRAGPELARQMVQQFPPEVAAASPEIHHVLGVYDWSKWETRSAEHHFAQADALFTARGDLLLAARSRSQRAITLIGLGRLSEAAALLDSLDERLAADATLAAVVALGRTWLALESCRFHDVAPAFATLVQHLEALGEPGNWFSTVPPPRQTPCRGIAPWLMRWVQGAQTVAGDEPMPLRAMALMTKAWAMTWQGQLEQAAELHARADAEAHWTGELLISRNHGLTLRCVLAACADDAAGVAALVRQRLAEHPRNYGDWGLWHVMFLGARAAARCGDAALLGELLQRLDALLPVLPDVTPARLQPLWGPRGNLAWLQQRADEAERCWRQGLQDESAYDLWGQVAETRVRLALLLARRGPSGEAKVLVQQVLDDRQPGGALFAQPALRELLALEKGLPLDEPARATLRAWADSGKARAPAAPAESPDALSSREHEVLALIARGASNKVIARELDLSPHTVKRHVANILTKLELAGRAQAAAWWQARQATAQAVSQRPA